MGFVEKIWVGKERAEAGFGAEQDRPSTVFGAREIGRVCITEDASAQGDERSGMGFTIPNFVFYGRTVHKQFGDCFPKVAMTIVISLPQ